jgi:hypothetical protein
MIRPTDSDFANRIAEFEHHLLDISNRLIAAPLPELHDEIDRALARTASYWCLDEVLLYELLADCRRLKENRPHDQQTMLIEGKQD